MMIMVTKQKPSCLEPGFFMIGSLFYLLGVNSPKYDNHFIDFLNGTNGSHPIF